MHDPADPAQLRARLQELAPELPWEISIRPMMGGHIGYADERPFVSISTGGLGVKLTPPDQQRLLDIHGTTRMRHSPNAPASRTYITLPPTVLDDDTQALHWLTLAAHTAPAPRRRASQPPKAP